MLVFLSLNRFCQQCACFDDIEEAIVSEFALKLCLVTKPDHLFLDQYLHFLSQAIEGGVTCVQLRDKHTPISILRTSAMAIKERLDSLKIPIIMNDHVELAYDLDVSGVHLGQNDASPLEARQVLGPDKIIGWSVESMNDLERANQLDCIDYIGASSVFSSSSKLDCKTIWGLGGLKILAEQSKHPVVAIGGIHAENAQDVVHHGAAGIAVISAIHNQTNPKLASNQLIQAINQGIHHA